MAKNTGNHLRIFQKRLILIPIRKTQKGSCILAVMRLGITMMVVPKHRHFRDKGELPEAIAVEGFERLTIAMRKRSLAGSTAADRLRLCGCGYVEFAVRWPQHFLVMFDLPKRGTLGENAFQTLLEFIVESQKERGFACGRSAPLGADGMVFSA